jgi:hypothetical protein
MRFTVGFGELLSVLLIVEPFCFWLAAAENFGISRQREGPEPVGGQNEFYPRLAEPTRIWRQSLCCQVHKQS